MAVPQAGWRVTENSHLYGLEAAASGHGTLLGNCISRDVVGILQQSTLPLGYSSHSPELAGLQPCPQDF